MSKIVWDKTGERYLESGVSHGVLYSGSKKLETDTVNMTRTTSTGSSDNPLYNGYVGWNAFRKWTVESFAFPMNFSLGNIDEMFDVKVRSSRPVYTRIEHSDGFIEMRETYPNVTVASGSDVIAAFRAAKKETRAGMEAWYLDPDADTVELLNKLRPISGQMLPEAARPTTASTESDPPWFVSFDGYYLRFYVATQFRSENAPGNVSPTYLAILPDKANATDARTKVSYQTVKQGVPWNGLISISASPEGAEDNDQWADNMKYSRTKSKETWGGSIEAYQSPKEFDACDGSAEAADGVNAGQQKRESFGLCYRTEIMNDASGGESCGYLLHLLYNLTASPSERSYETINDSPDAMTLSWELDGVPVNVEGYEPLTEITIDSRYAYTDSLAALEAVLYGTETSDARLPSAEEVIATMKAHPGEPIEEGSDDDPIDVETSG